VNTPGCFLDTYAREHLWNIGYDYYHGTGHGVGAALNVHEGPQRIAPVLPPNTNNNNNNGGLVAGMIVSNEPGYYEPNQFGIRIENLLIVKKHQFENNNHNNNNNNPPPMREFCSFEKLTMIPIQLKCVDIDLLTTTERQWLNNYHREVKEKVYPLLSTDRARAWLMKNTVEI
jgi:Xaa-Pro aminopeptidase